MKKTLNAVLIILTYAAVIIFGVYLLNGFLN